ncbi:XTP/dITP diphosphatase [soil metagenome]
MGKAVLIVTGNKRKIWQATSCLEPLGISVEARDVEIDEIQAHDPIKISLAKARAAFEAVGKPLVICDHSWSFKALNGFPGGYMKDVNQWFEPEDWLALMHGKQERAVVLTEVVVYIDDDGVRTFSADFPGHVLQEARGIGSVSMERVVAFDGTEKTIAEHIDAAEHARDMAHSAWAKFGAWFVEA